MNIDFNSYMLFLMACCRMAGMIFFNPIFGRQNIPSVVKVGLSMGLAVHAAVYMGDVNIEAYSAIETILAMIREFAIGFAIGYVLYLFMGIFHMSGQMIDMQMGYSMAMQYDPSSNSQISISGNLLTIMYTMLFFITNSHLNLMAIATKSFQVLPAGLGPLSTDSAAFAIELFGYLLLYAVQLALPIIVVEVLAEMAVGILMKMVPNINVFVVNFQIKMLVGLIVMLTIIPMLVQVLGKMNLIMMERIQEMISFLI